MCAHRTIAIVSVLVEANVSTKWVGVRTKTVRAASVACIAIAIRDSPSIESQER